MAAGIIFSNLRRQQLHFFGSIPLQRGPCSIFSLARRIFRFKLYYHPISDGLGIAVYLG
jgi:hypothetical protein